MVMNKEDEDEEAGEGDTVAKPFARAKRLNDKLGHRLKDKGCMNDGLAEYQIYTVKGRTRPYGPEKC